MRLAPILSSAIVGVVVTQVLWLRWHMALGRALAQAAQRFERRRDEAPRRVLVAGDSSAVGTGAHRPDDSVAGRIATAYPAVSIWNVAENGVRTAGVIGSLRALHGTRFDAVLIHVGVNDIVRFTPLARLRGQVGEALAAARDLSAHVFLLTGGNLGLAPALPRGLRWLIERRTRAVRRLFVAAAAAIGATYIDMFDGKVDIPFVADPARYFARDGFHPNSEGYALWYEAIGAAMHLAGVELE